MSIYPHTADIVVKDMARALAFYRLLGVNAPAEADGDQQVAIETEGHGMSLGFLTEALMAHTPLGWAEPVGGRISLAFKCGSPAEVDAVFARVTAAGHPSVTLPWDAPWGQRYASTRDPDGNRIDLFAALG
jgi:uncharacterized glyoxalase superfamily protein PhnB